MLVFNSSNKKHKLKKLQKLYFKYSKSQTKRYGHKLITKTNCKTCIITIRHTRFKFPLNALNNHQWDRQGSLELSYKNSFRKTGLVVDQIGGGWTISVISRFHVLYHHSETVTRKCILWNTHKQETLGTRLLNSALVYSWWYGCTIIFLSSNLHQGWFFVYNKAKRQGFKLWYSFVELFTSVKEAELLV